MSATTRIGSIAIGLAVFWIVTAGATASRAIGRNADKAPLPACGTARDIATTCDENRNGPTSPLTGWQSAVFRTSAFGLGLS